MATGNLVRYNEESKYTLWLSNHPEPASGKKRLPGWIRGGDLLIILQEEKDYTRVLTSTGISGWIPGEYLAEP